MWHHKICCLSFIKSCHLSKIKMKFTSSYKNKHFNCFDKNKHFNCFNCFDFIFMIDIFLQLACIFLMCKIALYSITIFLYISLLGSHKN